jgi:hypothetical protein
MPGRRLDRWRGAERHERAMDLFQKTALVIDPDGIDGRRASAHIELPPSQDRDLLRDAERFGPDDRVWASEYRAWHQLSAFELDARKLAHIVPFARHWLAASPPRTPALLIPDVVMLST